MAADFMKLGTILKRGDRLTGNRFGRESNYNMNGGQTAVLRGGGREG